MKVAALDLGTNSFLCLIAEGDNKGLQFVHKDLMKIVRLGQDLQKTGSIHPDALIRAQECLVEFKKEIEKIGVDQVLALATSAARDAKNKDEFLNLMRQLKIPVEIISGQREAEITYLGATLDYRHEKEKTFLVVDVGGGSTEFIVGRNNQILFAKSLDIGGVRLTEKYISLQPINLTEQKTVEEFITKEIQSVLPEIKKYQIDHLIAVAGTPTSIASIEVGGYDEQKVNNFILSYDRISHWQKQFAQTTIDEKKQKFHLGSRADIIYVGTSILKNTMKELNLDKMIVSTRGVRFGLANEMFLKGK